MQLSEDDLEEIIEEETKRIRRRAALKILVALFDSNRVMTTHTLNLPELAVELADRLLKELAKEKES